VPDKDLPVILPENASSPAKAALHCATPEFVNTTCPKCGGPARRGTTRWTLSSIPPGIFIAYCDPTTTKLPTIPPKLPTGFRSTSTSAASPTPSCTALFAFLVQSHARHWSRKARRNHRARLFTQGMVQKGGVAMSKFKGNGRRPMGCRKIRRRYRRLYTLFAAPSEKRLGVERKKASKAPGASSMPSFALQTVWPYHSAT